MVLAYKSYYTCLLTVMYDNDNDKTKYIHETYIHETYYTYTVESASDKYCTVCRAASSSVELTMR